MLTIFILLLSLVLYLEISQLFDIDTINKESLEIANENLNLLNYDNSISNKKTNKCIFGIFSELFEKSNSSFKYYPSNFAKYDITYKYSNLHLPDDIIEYMNSTEALKRDLIAIATECSSILKYYRI